MTIRNILRGSSAFRTAALATALLLPTAIFAADVTLRSADGTVNIDGEFIDFVDNTYVIRTELGDLRISAARVRCDGDACPDVEVSDADVVFAGSDTVGLGIMPLLLEGYAGFRNAENTVTATGTPNEILAEMVGDGGFGDEMGSFLVTSTGSSDAFRALLDQSANIGMASRRIRPAEARELRDSGAGNMVDPAQEHILAVDSLVVIVHPENPVQEISTEQLAGIYSGEISNWSDLGGEDLPIKVVGRQEASGTRGVFESRVFGDDPAPLPADAVIADDNNIAAAMVNEDPGAIGFVGFAFQRGAKPITLINECGIRMTPDAFSARTEEYALQRRLYLYNRGDDLPEDASGFLDFALSSDADGVIAKSGFIDLGVARRAQPLDGPRARALLDPTVDAYEGGIMRDMLAAMVDYDRLSTTFRFRTGSSTLDQRGILDLDRLVTYLESQSEGTEVVFVGFTDSVGEFDSNLALSRNRADSVLNQVAQLAGDRLTGISMRSDGYGEIVPSACNVVEDGRRINRRVEVWVKSPA